MSPISETQQVDGVWLVAVDDDPTGCQSVSGVPLLTAWDDLTLATAARRRAPVTFVLTNSRSMSEADAVKVNHDVGMSLARVAEVEGVRLRLISRSDSTLRGHFPAEVDSLVQGAGIVPDGVVLCPAFFEAGRFTAEGIHWVHRDGELVPARDTEFAADASFGFTELTLADWARARGAPADVIEIGLEALSRPDTDGIAATLRGAAQGQAVVVNAMNYEQLESFDAAARQAEAAGSTFVYRTGPSFVRTAAGLGQPVIADLARGDRAGDHGLIIVGSHTAVTNAQVSRAAERHRLHIAELDATAVLDADRVQGHLADVARATTEALSRGSVVLRTSRSVITEDATRTPLELSRAIADALTETVRQISSATTPAWVVAKGGITSHDLLTNAFGVRTAEVVGQALAGIIPVLDIDIGGRRAPFIVFPGNVGDENTLAEVFARLDAS